MNLSRQDQFSLSRQDHKKP